MRLFILVPPKSLNPECSASTYYRVLVPSRYLRDDFEIRVSESINQNDLYVNDIIMFSRPSTAESLQFAITAKRMGRRVVVDWDDNIFCIPPSNPAYNIFDHAAQKAAREIMRVADSVLCSTQNLKTYFQEFSADVRLVPNICDPAHHKVTKENHSLAIPKKEDEIRLLWTGSLTHHEEMKQIIDPVNEILSEYKNVSMVYFGLGPENIVNPERTYIVGRTSLLNYFISLPELGADIMLVPLTDNPFNRCKSNIRWIEASTFDMVTLASDVPAYDNLESVYKVTKQDWRAWIEEFIHQRNYNLLEGKKKSFEEMKTKFCWNSNHYMRWKTAIGNHSLFD